MKSERAKKLMKMEGPVEILEGEDPGFSTSILSLLPELYDFIGIFGNLGTDSSSPEFGGFSSVINSCPMWREMFKTATTSKLLPLVLSVLVNHNMSAIDFLRWRSVNHATKSVIESVLRRKLPPLTGKISPLTTFPGATLSKSNPSTFD
ncbi:hypothetical protein Ocin01_20140 [Orchesella cincta]|uniref:Uncharacterized protein n=1 Tax=Orchesella cincta TaxID=48709 RepID=A0A1D2M0U7_ORCCI|nr:hypothetical protein Ocin01_20140 [Orchesella cincta]